MSNQLTKVTVAAVEAAAATKAVVAAAAVEPVAHQSSLATSHGLPPSTSSAISSPAAAQSASSAFWLIARLTAHEVSFKLVCQTINQSPKAWASASSAPRKSARAPSTVSTDTRSTAVNSVSIMRAHATKHRSHHMHTCADPAKYQQNTFSLFSHPVFLAILKRFITYSPFFDFLFSLDSTLTLTSKTPPSTHHFNASPPSPVNIICAISKTG